VPQPPIETFTGTLEARWWSVAPEYGESPEDPFEPALVLRLDTPRGGVEHVIYASNGVDDLVPDAAAMTCVGGRAEVAGVYTSVLWRQAPAVVDKARIVSCSPVASFEPPFGETATLTGTLRRWWWYMAPGFGKDPRTDKLAIGAVLVVDDRPIPLFSEDTHPGAERHRRFLSACDGQEVTLTGRWEATKNPEVRPAYKLVEVVYSGPCANPSLPRPTSMGDKSMPKEWLE
jgi:hypothetical protein